MFRPKLSVVYILATLFSLALAQADDRPRLKVVGGNPSVERASSPSGFAGYEVPPSNPWLVGWNYSDIAKNNLVSRAVMAAYSKRPETFGVTEPQMLAAMPLLRLDPRGLTELTEQEYLELKSELHFGLQSIEPLLLNRSAVDALKIYVSFLGPVFQYTPEELSEDEWVKLTNRLTVDLLGLWIVLIDDPNDLFVPEGETFLSTRSFLASTLLKLPLSPHAQKEIEKIWLSTMQEEFSNQRLYGYQGETEYVSNEEAIKLNLDIPAEYTIGRWIKEVNALMESRLSLARGKLLTKMLVHNMMGIESEGDMSEPNPARDVLTRTLSKALAAEINKRGSTWQHFLPEYNKRKHVFGHKEILLAMAWSNEKKLFEHRVVGEDIRTFVRDIFEQHWSRIYNQTSYISDYQLLPLQFSKNLEVEENTIVHLNLQRVLSRIFEVRSDDYRDIVLGSGANLNITVEELYSLMNSIEVDREDRVLGMRMMMRAYVGGSLHMSPEFDSRIFADYKELIGEDSKEHKKWMESFVSIDLTGFPTISQLSLFNGLASLSGDEARAYKEKHYLNIIKMFIFSSNQEKKGAEYSPARVRLNKTLETLGFLRQTSGDDYKDNLLFILDMLDAWKNNDEKPSKERHRKMKRRKKGISQEQAGYEHLQDEFQQHILKQLRLFGADPLVQDLCNGLFD